MLRLVGGDRALAEDLTQEVFLRVFQGLPGFSLRSKFTTWLFQVTKNRVLDELRAVERRPRALVASTTSRRSRCSTSRSSGSRTIDALWRAVENLNTDLKMALLLRDVVGLSYTEIADSLEVTLATVKWRIYKAREEVQIALVREGITFGARRAGHGRAALARSHAAIFSPAAGRSSRAGSAGRAACRGFGAGVEPPRGAEHDSEHDRGHDQECYRGGQEPVRRWALAGCERQRRLILGAELPGEARPPRPAGRRGCVRGAHERVLDAARHAGASSPTGVIWPDVCLAARSASESNSYGGRPVSSS